MRKNNCFIKRDFHSIFKLRLLYLVLLFSTINADAQLLPFKKYTEKDGLNSKIISSAVCDNRGLLWVGTPFGIHWFDGSKFYQPPVPKKVEQLYVYDFYKDKEGTIWTLTFYNGLYKFQNGHFTDYLIDSTYSYANKNNVFEMLEISEGHYLVATDDNVYLFDEKNFTLFDSANAQLNGQIRALARLPDGTILIGGNGLFCYRYRNAKWSLSKKVLPGIEINKIITHHQKTWIATNKGVYYFDHFSTNETPPPVIYLKGENIFHCSESSHGDVWISTAEATYKLLNNKLTRYDNSNGITGGSTQTYTDSEGTTWFSTGNGLYKLGKAYYTYKKFQPDYLNGILSISKDEKKQIWVGRYNGYSNLSNNYSYNFPNVNGKNAEETSLFYAPVSRQLWVTNKQGMFELKNGRPEKRFSFECSAFYQDKNGMIWLATNDGRLFIFDQYRLRQIFFPDFENDFITTIYKDKKSFLWLGFRTAGIIKYAINDSGLEKIKEFSNRTGFPEMRMRSCISDKNGNILFGTRTNGLFIFSEDDEKKYWHLDNSSGLKASWIKEMDSDETNIYMATNDGLVVLKQQKKYNHPLFHAVNFSTESISKETSGILAIDGKVLIGVNGLVSYYPDKDQPDTTPLPVYLTQIVISGKTDSSFQPYSQQKNILHLPYSKNIVSFEFAGIHLTDENPPLYRYKLQGQDDDWSAATKRNFVSYNLPPGHYKFIVQAQNENGAWSKTPATYSFNIQSPFWNTWWFISLVALIAVVIIYMLYQYRINQLLKMEKLRSKISTDLHDEIGSTLSSISILSDLALHSNDERQHQQMAEEIKENSIALMEKMDDIVWSINPQNDSLEKLLVRIRRFSSKLFEAKDIDYTIKIDDSVTGIKLPMEYRQHIYLILKEAINNMVKYSDCTKANIHVFYHHAILQVDITDNGKGFDAGKVEAGNGLINMQNRAKLMNAELAIASTAQNGTSICLKVKIK